jgi:hypothetical protein
MYEEIGVARKTDQNGWNLNGLSPTFERKRTVIMWNLRLRTQQVLDTTY